MTREDTIDAILDVYKIGEPEDYGFAAGLEKIKAELDALSDDELDGELDFLNDMLEKEAEDYFAEREREPDELEIAEQLVAMKKECEEMTKELVENYTGNDPEKYKAQLGAMTYYELFETLEAYKNPEVTARVTPIENGSLLKGIGTVTIGNQISVHGVKILEKPDGTLGMAMPSEKGKDGKFYETAIPASKEAYAKIKDAVFEAYETAKTLGKQEKDERAPQKVNIKVGGIRENADSASGVKGVCQVTVNDMLVIKNVKVITTKAGELSVGLPQKQNQYGEYDSIATPTNKAFFAKLKEAVVNKYVARGDIIGSVKYGDLGAKEDLKHTSLNSVFARKVAAQLDEMGVKWSGRKNANNTTSIAVNKADEGSLAEAVGNAKELAQSEKQAAAKVTQAVRSGEQPVAGKRR